MFERESQYFGGKTATKVGIWKIKALRRIRKENRICRHELNWWGGAHSRGQCWASFAAVTLSFQNTCHLTTSPN